MDAMGSVLNGRYEIIGELGAGAMGVVYHARDLQGGDEVAIKVLPPALARDPRYLARFEREAQALRELNHPNIVTFIDSFQADANYYIAMEYMPGGSLYDLLQNKGALPIDEARQIAIDISDALIRAHRLDIVHRDLKPENILFDAEGNPRLADFGVAGMTEPGEGTRLTGTGMQMGTPYYMSPEAWQGQRLDAQSDIWSLGIVLYEMLSGELPFRGGTAIAVMRQVLQSPTPDIRNVRDDIPDGIYEIIRKSLAKDTSQRYDNVRDLSGDLERGEPANPLKGSGSGQRSSWRGGLLVAGVVIILVIIAVVIGVLALGGDQEPDLAALPTPTESPISPASQTAGPTNTVTPRASDTPTQSAREIAQATLDQEGTLVAEFTAIAAENQQTLEAAQSATAAAWTDTPTNTATLTPTPTSTATNTPDPSEAPVVVFPEDGVPLLASPQEDSFATSTVFADFAETLPILAVSEDGNYYQVQFFQRTGWIDADMVEVQGDLASLTGAQTIEVAVAPSDVEPVTQNADWTPVVQDFDGVEMVLVPPGCFMMGSEDGDEDEVPVHEQCLDEPFWIDRYEMTNGQFEANGGVSQRGPSRVINNVDLPRAYVTWFEARDYCEQLGVRLPTEAEWEYAARGPDGWVFPWGNAFVPENANCGECADNPGQLEDVGGWPEGVSWIGALDMSGNVSEWVSSISWDYPYAAADGREDMENEELYRTMRGGAFGFSAYHIRAADRSSRPPEYADSAIGFRCARDFEATDTSFMTGDELNEDVTTVSELFFEDFEDGHSTRFTVEYGAGWSVLEDEQGNMVYDANRVNAGSNFFSGVSFGNPSWDNYELEYEFRVLEHEEDAHIAVFFRRSGTAGRDNAYLFGFDLFFNGTYIATTTNSGPWLNLAHKNLSIEENVWHSVSIQVNGPMIEVFLNDVLLLEAEDIRFTEGQLMLSVHPGIHAQFDNLRVTALD